MGRQKNIGGIMIDKYVRWKREDSNYWFCGRFTDIDTPLGIYYKYRFNINGNWYRNGEEMVVSKDGVYRGDFIDG